MTRQACAIQCSSCGRRYRFNPRWAGQQVRCLCEAVLSYPVAPPVPAHGSPREEAPALEASGEPDDPGGQYALALPDEPVAAPVARALPARPAAAAPLPRHARIPHAPDDVDEYDDDEDDDEEPTATFLHRLLAILGQYMPGLFRPAVILMSSITTLIASALMGYGGWAGIEGEIQGSVMFVGLATLVHAQGIVWMVTGRIEMIHESIVDMDGLWGIFVTLTLVPILLGIGITYVVGMGAL
ncbi:MAG: hypothetical protein IT440_10485 [Phycisphaeraceae bacterium]|nr:hypothetical protein [Phycisphaeraceae bacterium]